MKFCIFKYNHIGIFICKNTVIFQIYAQFYLKLMHFNTQFYLKIAFYTVCLALKIKTGLLVVLLSRLPMSLFCLCRVSVDGDHRKRKRLHGCNCDTA